MQSKFYKMVVVIILLALTLTGFSAARAQQESSGTLREVIYLTDTLQRADGKSLIFTVAIDQLGGQANLTLLPNGELPFDNVDALAVTPDGSRIYMIDDGLATYPNATLAYYDVATDQIVTVGVVTYNGENLYEIDQATFSKEGVLYITQNVTDALFTVNPENAEATEVGPIVNQASGELLDIFGADIAIDADGSFYLITNLTTTGVYKLDLPAEPGVVTATLLGPTGDNHRVRGLSVRANGYGDLVAATQADEVHIVDRETGADIIQSLPLYWNGSPFRCDQWGYVYWWDAALQQSKALVGDELLGWSAGHCSWRPG